MKHFRMPYKNIETAAYVTAINILAVEYLIKQNDRKEYTRRVEQVLSLSEIDLEILFVRFDLNMHIGSLGAMITHDDYNYQKEILLDFLDETCMINQS